jgi:anti-sigma-K factor RskA
LDIKEFISSGLLETYVLGNANPEEIKMVREMEKLHPEIKEEIEAIEISLLEYSEAQTNIPSVELKNRIQKKIFEKKNDSETKVFNLKSADQNQNNYYRYAAVASIALLICSVAFNVVLFNKNTKSQSELSAIRNQNNEIAEQMEDLQTNLFNKNNELAMIMKPGNKMVSLKGMENSPSSHAMIVWSPEDKMVLVNSISLPPAPEGMQYQLWALMDGKTVNAGMIDLTQESIMIKLDDMPPAQAFAVTLEKMGGSPVPNMKAMYLMGNV